MQTRRGSHGAYVADSKEEERVLEEPRKDSQLVPTRFVLAGPNACGKSTLTATGLLEGIKTIDPDAIARNADEAHEPASS